MYEVVHLPAGRWLGPALLVVAAALALASRRAAAPRQDRLGVAAGACGLAGFVLLAAGLSGFPTYGLMMLLGFSACFALAWRWAGQRGVSQELIVELGLLGIVFGLLGARGVFIVEQWDAVFADRAPGMPSPGIVSPLAPGDELRLHTHRGLVIVHFRGDETMLEQVRARIEEDGADHGLVVRLKTTQHRGANGIEVTQRGFVLKTRDRGPDARLAVLAGPAAEKLGLTPGTMTRGEHIPLWRVLDLRMGGLTYFGSVFGVLASWVVWLRYRGVRMLDVLDAVAPMLPLGLAFGRVGCLARGCCWGREAGPDAVCALSYPPWSLPWSQMASERLTCDFDRALATRELTPAMEAALGGLAQGTPPLHATQLYEGVAVLAIFALLVVFRARLQRRIGQCFLLVFLLQCPVRFADEHLRRDHDVFLTVPGLDYPFTETQAVAAVLLALSAPALVWVSLRGRPLPAAARAGAPAAPPPAGAPAGAPESAAAAAPRGP